MSERKLFGRWNDLVNIIFGILLTATAGTIITNNINNKRQQSVRAETIVNEVSQLLDYRKWASYKLYWGYSTKGISQEEIYRRKIEYENMMTEYNSKLNATRVGLSLYFGSKAEKRFMAYHGIFRNINKIIAADSAQYKPSDLESAKSLLDSIGTEAYFYISTLEQAILDGKIGKSSGELDFD